MMLLLPTSFQVALTTIDNRKISNVYVVRDTSTYPHRLLCIETFIGYVRQVQMAFTYLLPYGWQIVQISQSACVLRPDEGVSVRISWQYFYHTRLFYSSIVLLWPAFSSQHSNRAVSAILQSSSSHSCNSLYFRSIRHFNSKITMTELHRDFNDSWSRQLLKPTAIAFDLFRWDFSSKPVDRQVRK